MKSLSMLRGLGDWVEQAWRRNGFANERFSALARDALAEVPPIELEELIEELLTVSVLPKQFAITSDFGDPPITVYSSERFVVDLCFWVQPRTSVHSHNFTGAFKVMRGLSLHTVYGFAIEESYAGELLVGDLQAKHGELLREGDIREIATGLGFIHQVCHLPKPSMSIVVRTAEAAPSKHVYSFYGMELAVGQVGDKNAESHLRRRQLGEMLRVTTHPARSKMLATAASKRSPAEQFELLISLARDFSDRDWEHTLALAYETCPNWLPRLRTYAQSTVNTRLDWSVAQTEAHRLWLSLLQSHLTKSQIRDLVEGYAGGADFAATAMKWTTECCDSGALGFSLNSVARVMLNSFFEGYSLDETARAVAARFHGATPGDVRGDVRSFQAALSRDGLFATFLPSD